MKREEIIQIANEALVCQQIWIDEDDSMALESVILFAKLVAAKERKDLCKYFQELEDKATSVRDKMYLSGVQFVIRARGEA